MSSVREAPALLHPAELAQITAAYEHERATCKVRADSHGRPQTVAYDEIKKQSRNFRTSTRPALEQILTDHELRLNPDSVPAETRFLDFSVPKANIDIESALTLRHQLNQYRRISRNDVRSGPVYSPVHSNDDGVSFDDVLNHEMMRSAHLNHAMDVRQEELQHSAAHWKHLGPQQANQIKVLHKMLTMRDRLRNLRDRFSSDQMRSNLDLSSGVSLLNPSHCIAAPANAALLPHISKAESEDVSLIDQFRSSWQLNLSVPSHSHFPARNSFSLPIDLNSISSDAPLPRLDSEVALLELDSIPTQAAVAESPVAVVAQNTEIKEHELNEWRQKFRESQEFAISKTLHGLFLRAVVDQHRQFKDYHAARAKLLATFAKQAAPLILSWERRAQRKRINDMKADNMEEYIAMIKQQKDQRLNMVLNQTDIFLKKLGDLVKRQQNTVSFEEEVGPDGKRIPKAKLSIKEKTAQQKRQAESEAAREMEELLDQNRDQDSDTEQSEVSSSAAYYKLVHGVEEEVKSQPKLLSGGTLKDYQMVSLQWMVSLYNNNLNGILADEMGLGKTIQTISLFSYLIETKQNNGPFLVIVPLTTLSNWKNEFEKWAPTIKVISYVGGAANRNDLYYDYLYVPKSSRQQMPGTTPEVPQSKFNVLLTTYEYVIHKVERPRLCSIPWQYMVVDEGHRLKNHHSKLAQILSTHYRTAHRLLLTGTPLQNSLTELWALLNFLLPQIFNSSENFEVWFNKPFESSGVNTGDENTELQEEEKLLIIHRLHQVLRPFILRRMKKEVASQLPEKVERVLKCELSAWQKVVYNQISHRTLSVQNANTGEVSAKGLKNTLMQLRKVCNHPYLFDDEGAWTDKPTSDEIMRSSGKFDLLDRILPKMKASGHRVLLFTQMTRLLDVLEPYLEWRGWNYLRLDGSTKSEERAQLIQEFNAPDSPHFLFILSTRAGGLGLNLQTADTVIIFDSDWNPQMDVQAQDRAHRLGQKNEVRVLRFCTISPIEEHILRRAQSKLEMDYMVIKAGKFNKSELDDDDDADTPEQEKQELATILRKGVALHGGDQDTAVTDDQINEMLARSEEEFESFQQMDVEAAEAEAAAMAAAAKSRRGPKSKAAAGARPRLMAEDELPDHLKISVQELVDQWSGAKQQREIEENYGKGRRERAQGTYRELSDRQFEKWLEEGGDPSSFIKTRNRKKNQNKRRGAGHDEDDAESDPSDGSGDEAQQSQDEEVEEPAENDDEVVAFGRRRTRSAVKASAPRPTRQSRRASASSPSSKRRRVEISDDEPDDEDVEAALAAEFE